MSDEKELKIPTEDDLRKMVESDIVDDEALEEALEESSGKAEKAGEKPDGAEDPSQEESEGGQTYTDVQQKAMKLGWRPKDEFKGDESNWKDASAFMERYNTRDQISKQGAKLSRMQRVLENMSSVINRQAQLLEEKEKNRLDLERHEAILAADVKRVNQIDDEMHKMDVNRVKSHPVPRETAQFVEENADWYGPNKAMTRYAEAYGAELFNSNPKMSVKDQLNEIRKEMERTFPNHFKKTSGDQKEDDYVPKTMRTEKPDNQGRSRASKKYTYADLPPDYKKVVRQYCDVCDHLTRDEYAKSLFNTIPELRGDV